MPEPLHRSGAGSSPDQQHEPAHATTVPNAVMRPRAQPYHDSLTGRAPSTTFSGAGLALSTLGQLVPPDAWSQERTSIFSIVSMHGSHQAISTTSQDFFKLEHYLLQLLMKNEDSGNFSRVNLQGRIRSGLAVAGTQYGEILPPWVDAESGEAIASLRGAALQTCCRITVALDATTCQPRSA